MVPSSSNDRLMLLDSLQTFEHSANSGGKSLESIANTQTNNQHTRKESYTKWSAGGSISLQDIVKHYGKKKREEAAESLQVSVSTFKRLCRQHGISRWPSTKGKRDKSFLFTQKSIASFQAADGEYASASQSQKALLSALQPFSASSTAIETHQESSLFSIHSNRREGGQSHYHNMLGNIKTTKGKNMPQGRASTNKSQQCKARNGSLSIKNLMPDSLEKTSRPPQNCMPCDQDSGTSSTSNHKRKSLEKETDCTGKVTHFEEQPSEMQNCVSKRQAVDSASKDSSFLSSIIGTIVGNNMGYIPNSISGHDIVDSTHMGVQPSLESISTHPLNSFSCNVNTAKYTKLIREGSSADQEALYKPQELEPGHDSLIPAYPGQQGEEIARQIEMADGTSHLEKQYLGRERLCSNNEKEVIVSVEESSWYEYDFRNVSEPNQDHLTDFPSLCEVDEDQWISLDDLESDCIKVQSILESEAEPSLQNDARRMKMIFEKLIMLPLEDLTNPNLEASMKEALTILADNLSLFADEQAKQLLELKFDFPTITYSWRDCSQSRIDCRNFLAEFENTKSFTKSLLDTSIKEGEDLKDRYTQIECKEKEMMAQLEAIQTEKNEISKQKSENFHQTKHLAALKEEQASKTKEKELQMTIASAKLDKLKSQWVSVQSSFN